MLSISPLRSSFLSPSSEPPDEDTSDRLLDLRLCDVEEYSNGWPRGGTFADREGHVVCNFTLEQHAQHRFFEHFTSVSVFSVNEKSFPCLSFPSGFVKQILPIDRLLSSFINKVRSLECFSLTQAFSDVVSLFCLTLSPIFIIIGQFDIESIPVLQFLFKAIRVHMAETDTELCSTRKG